MNPIILKIREKIVEYIKITIFLLLFILFYFYVPFAGLRYTLIYFLVLASLYFSFKTPELAFVINSAGIALVCASGFLENLAISIPLIFLLMSTTGIPLYFGWARHLEQDSFRKRRKPKVELIDSLQNNLTGHETRLDGLEKKIDRINRLYNLGRELVVHMNMNEVINNLQRVILSRPGIESVSIFSLDKNIWEPVYFSQEKYKQKWLDYIENNKPLLMKKKFRVLPSPGWLNNRSVVFWPARLEKDMLAAIILTTTNEMADFYLEEGEIFIPQIALGLKRTNLFAEVQERSRIDGLTGLYLRRYFLERFYLEIQRAKRYSSVFSIFMADIDFFKKINDTFGHLVGDEVLKKLAQILVSNSSPSALVSRYGGEEFVVLLLLLSPQDSLNIAKKINKAVTDHTFRSANSNFHLTLSIGISHYPNDGDKVKDLLSAADHALYWVKTHGRNNIKEFSQNP
ncbi:MAG: GGDEF domain-containing protein [Elusimicrobia bacterium]|nr:GGDEF domain-containing protein [Candidatus Liberimonas magnetica]